MKDDRIYLEHIRDSIVKIESYVPRDKNTFLDDPKTQDAVLRNFEIIGETAKRVSGQTKSHKPMIPWKQIAGFRDVLIHNYMGIDLDEVWNVITDHLPALKNAVVELLDQ